MFAMLLMTSMATSLCGQSLEATSSRGMVVSVSKAATEAGVAVLDRGAVRGVELVVCGAFVQVGIGAAAMNDAVVEDELLAPANAVVALDNRGADAVDQIGAGRAHALETPEAAGRAEESDLARREMS